MRGVFVVGAGPAGMFAARKLAQAGYETFIFNRDIRPGGLAQYGIYPTKSKMKIGLRKQFEQTLALPNVHYFGHVQIGAAYDLSLEELESFRPSAIIFASGAQGAKKLGLPGEDAAGVYAAKDYVYNYNQLESHVALDFSAHKHIAVVGVGNVAIDVVRWLLNDKPARTTESVTIVARRGPLEVKFDSKEIGYVDVHIDRGELVGELERVRGRCARVNQDVSPDAVIPARFPGLAKPDFASVAPRLNFRFLSSPKAFVPDAEGRVAHLILTENELVLNADGSTSARPTAETSTLDVDTVLFAIGDSHDPKIGLPMGAGGYAVKPIQPDCDAASYEVWDPAAGEIQPGRFVVGWARKASTGLAGVARHDGEIGAERAIEYLQSVADTETADEAHIRTFLASRGMRVVDKDELKLLACAEARLGPIDMPNSFRFKEEAAIFQAIDEEKARVGRDENAAASAD